MHLMNDDNKKQPQAAYVVHPPPPAGYSAHPPTPTYQLFQQKQFSGGTAQWIVNVAYPIEEEQPTEQRNYWRVSYYYC
uniref:Uncharacterized protein n=1 Tax=Ditylenchus dipsaci TaxID=166011 RepID=A0A915DJN0_9BILA